VSDAVRRCYLLVERMGEAWVATTIAPILQGDDLDSARLHLPPVAQDLKSTLAALRPPRRATELHTAREATEADDELASQPMG
jgi:hypothetical protein